MENPFAALLQDTNSPPLNTTSDERATTETLEETFGFTLNKDRRGSLIFLEDLSASFPSGVLNVEVLEHALFERLLLTNSQDVGEAEVFVYLFHCFKKTSAISDVGLREKVEALILRNAVTALKQELKELFEGQDLVKQFYEILKTLELPARDFFEKIYKRFCDDGDTAGTKEPFTMLLKLLHIDIARATPVSFPVFVFEILNSYVSDEFLAGILLDYCQPPSEVGIEYANTLLGAVFSVSVLPKVISGSYEFFQDPLDQASNAAVQSSLWMNTNHIFQDMHAFLLNLLKCGREIRIRTLTWLCNCLKANVDRGKLWNAHVPDFNLSNGNTVTDGFMLNITTVLLRLCHPFCVNIKDGRILKVDPTYCAVSNEDALAKDVHLLDMSKETSLIPHDSEQEERPASSSYNFVTECFFMAHRSFDLSFRVTNDKLVHLNQEMSRIERAYQDVLSQGPMSEIADSIKQRMASELSKYLSIKCAMSEPHFQESLFNFMSASAFWLSQVAVSASYKSNRATSAPIEAKEIVFPLPAEVPDTLKCIPEFVLENIVCFLVFLRRFNPKVFEEQGYERLSPILTFILVYMGSAQYTKNPHLRAHLAEALETLLPYHKEDPVGLNTLGGIQRERLFKEHPHRGEIVAILLDVFVGIEMTGQNVQFEQKFNYRRPMYLVMDYLWAMEEYRLNFVNLAQEAELNMEAVSPPIFLRFINLLINDAIFLLDESLSNMAKLRELQRARDAGEWGNLPPQERAQNMGNLQHTGMLARFDNILGKDTIRTLEYLTSEIKMVFTHSTMVDRVAAMLNYFLLNLVGPNQKNFKVKDFKEYSFDPAATVLDICKIYVNLKESDSFCLAISQDGRSYSPQLFELAEVVLVRIGGGTLIGELQDVSKKVERKAAEYKKHEIAVAEAPDQFLDPIMSTLMSDPVILPSSRQTVDRSTIARHLLSDQTDPFNRAPLSMDQVIPNKELAGEIKKWLDEKKLKL
uniref:Ubiquitin conjugation factor E4 A n=1 Tax=Photinus pyralis TaxID=7054 RepID=A0A1Y1K3I1_PHOPY